VKTPARDQGTATAGEDTGQGEKTSGTEEIIAGQEGGREKVKIKITVIYGFAEPGYIQIKRTCCNS
jgi:hypothetical protein